jgi:diguanylate cyclase (GGDEF)-like protein
MIDKLRRDLDEIIDKKQIRTVFQPIVSLRDGSVLGHEALSRITCDSTIDNIAMLFRYASVFNRLWDLEQLTRTNALEAAFKFMVPPYDKKLFLNVDPNIMLDPSFREGFTSGFLKTYEISPDNLIFEINERNIIKDFKSFQATLDHYRGQNYKVAIDDAGSGYSGLNLISGINPHYIKLDINLIRNVDTDRLKQSIIKGMVEVSKGSGIELIAEGIETLNEMEALINMGVHYGQGYLIQIPEERIHPVDKILVARIKEHNRKRNALNNYPINKVFIRNIATLTETISPSTKVSEVYDHFKLNHDSFGLCIVESDKPLGIITPAKLSSKLSGQFGYTLYQNKTIGDIMCKEFMMVDVDTPLKVVADMAMSRDINKLYDFIIVTDDGRYAGTATIKDLLEKTTEIELISAKHQSPLTGLPGNLIIEQELQQMITCGNQGSVAYVDIDNFKAYNDCYGFEKGDGIIKLLAKILMESQQNQFVGHVGGDDFVLVMDHKVEDSHFEKIRKRFEKEAIEFYNYFDRTNGYVSVNDRYGKLQRCPLVSITSVFLNIDGNEFGDIYQLTERLAELKSNVKKSKRSHL